MTVPSPNCLLYVLTCGKEKELVLRLHDPLPDEKELESWMRDGAVVSLHVSRHGEEETFTLLMDFGHIVTARLAPYTDTRIASF